jgi:hypothetical protein
VTILLFGSGQGESLVKGRFVGGEVDDADFLVVGAVEFCFGKLVGLVANNQIDDCDDLGRGKVGAKRKVEPGLIDVLGNGGGLGRLLVEGDGSSGRRRHGRLFLRRLGTRNCVAKFLKGDCCSPKRVASASTSSFRALGLA